MFQIGHWNIQHPTILAPMAGVTDAPFRRLCHQLGAGMTVSEMITSDERLWSSRKSQQRLSLPQTNPTLGHEAIGPRSVQLAGNDPQMMASAARANESMGAQIIDINMGCPAKKVCKKAAGSALLKDETLVKDILTAVVNAVSIPVTLKIRTGWSKEQRNGVAIARIAEDCGIRALAVHGRTRVCAFKGNAEYDTIAEIVDNTHIPVFANGDISSPEKAKYVVDYTGAAAIMVGRAAQGNPWIFREINYYLSTGVLLPKPTTVEVCSTLRAHLTELHHFYGDLMGVRIARKHVGWYLKQQTVNHCKKQDVTTNTDWSNRSSTNTDYTSFRHYFNRIESPEEQLKAVRNFFLQHLLTTEELKEEIAA